MHVKLSTLSLAFFVIQRRLAKVLQPREASEITTRVGSSYGGNHSIQWLQPPRNIFIVTKRHDGPIVEALARLIE